VRKLKILCKLEIVYYVLKSAYVDSVDFFVFLVEINQRQHLIGMVRCALQERQQSHVHKTMTFPYTR
jgi:hypothetical protein